MNASGQTQQTMAALQALGITLPSPAYLIGALFFGLIGLVAFRLGKVRENPWTRWLGLALMVYPYAVSNTELMYAIGAALCVALYCTRTT